MLTTIDQNDTLEVYVSVPVERAGDLKIGLPLRVLSSDGSDTLAATTIGFISPQRGRGDAVDSREGHGAESRRQAAIVAVRARAHRVEDGRRARRAGHGRRARQRSVLRVRRRERRTAKLVAHQRAIKVGPIVGDDYPVLEGIKPGERVVVSGAQKLVDGAPIAPAA